MSDGVEAYFKGKTWLVHGGLSRMSHHDAEAAITRRGGVLLSSASEALDVLLVEDEASAEVGRLSARARWGLASGAEVVTLAAFEALLAGRVVAPSLSAAAAMPAPFAALHAPSPELDLTATFFRGLRWYVHGTLRDAHGVAIAADALRARARRYHGVKLRLTQALRSADFIACEGDTPGWGVALPPVLQAARARGVPIFGERDFWALLGAERPG